MKVLHWASDKWNVNNTASETRLNLSHEEHEFLNKSIHFNARKYWIEIQKQKKKKLSVFFPSSRSSLLAIASFLLSYTHIVHTFVQSNMHTIKQGIFPSWKSSSRKRDSWSKCEMRTEENKMNECVTVTTWCTYTTHSTNTRNTENVNEEREISMVIA